MLELAYTMHRGAPSAQQDALLVADHVYQSVNLLPRVVRHESSALVAIADGVAASPGAARASRRAVEVLAATLAQLPDATADGMIGKSHVRRVQEHLCDAMARGAVSYGASTTLVAAHVHNGRVAVINVGNSRVYLVRNTQVTQISRDHTQLQALRDAGELDANIEYASLYNALTDCLVADPEASDFEIHRATLALEPGDLIVLCSDGIQDTLGETGWRELLMNHAEPLQLVKATRSAVLHCRAPDNFTLLAMRIA